MIWYALLDTPSHSNEGIEGIRPVRPTALSLWSCLGDSYLRASSLSSRWFCRPSCSPHPNAFLPGLLLLFYYRFCAEFVYFSSFLFLGEQSGCCECPRLIFISPCDFPCLWFYRRFVVFVSYLWNRLLRKLSNVW